MDFNISRLSLSMQKFQDDNITQKELLSVPPFPESEMTLQAISDRIERQRNDYWYFDKTYFPADMYSGGYYEPSVMHKKIIELAQINGVHLLFGPRGDGKTVTAKKALIWLLINKVKIAGTYAETIDKAENIMQDIAELIESNERLANDFKPYFKIKNTDKMQFRFEGIPDKKWRYMQPFSERRSVRGYTRLFARPQVVIGDDIETLETPMSPEHTEHRINKISETFQSLASDIKVFLLLANDFTISSALHSIRIEQEEGILPESWDVHIFQAWDEEKNEPMWKEKYPNIKSEDELKRILQPKDEADWQSNFQQNPMTSDGFIFRREDYQEWSALPDDLKSVLYCDPNLSKKGKGDTTGITVLSFSAQTQKFYVLDARCKSFSDSNDLLDGIWQLFINRRILAIGMDGHVTQESIWTNNVKHWSREKGRPFPKIEYMRLNTDDLAKTVQLAWTAGDILFPPDFAKSQEGKEYVKQLFSFRGKKANRRDDAPDSLIGAYHLIHNRHYVRKGRNLLAETRSFVEESIYRF